MDALVFGVVAFDPSEGCLLLSLGSESVPVVWPSGTRWRADPPGVILPNGEIATPGMTVRGAGGFLKHDSLVGFAGTAVADAASRCTSETGEIAVFNKGSEVVVEGD